MSDANSDHPSDDVLSESLLAGEGYKQELDRELSVLETVGLVLSDITPTASIFALAAMVFPMAGTGSFYTFLAAGVIAICVGASMAELGSAYPIAGGLYSIVARVLGKPLGYLAMIDYVMQAIFLPASMALGIAVYMSMFFPNINSNYFATLIMVLVTIVAIFRVKTNSHITAVFLVLELIVIAVIVFLGFSHPVNSLSTLLHPLLITSKGASPVAFGVVISAIAVALFSYNGYDSAINFSEETAGSARNVGRSVMIACSLGVFFQVIAVMAMLFGAKSLPDFFSSSLPISTFIQGYLGEFGTKIMIIGVVLAVLNGTLAIVLQFSRMVYSTARDQSWPGPVNQLLSHIHPSLRTPWTSVLFVGIAGTILTFFSSVVTAITFTSVFIIILYALIAIAAIVHRFFGGRHHTPYRMKLWPLPPAVALVGVLLALYFQTSKDLIICGVIFVVGLLLYFWAASHKTGFWRRTTAGEHS